MIRWVRNLLNLVLKESPMLKNLHFEYLNHYLTSTLRQYLRHPKVLSINLIIRDFNLMINNIFSDTPIPCTAEVKNKVFKKYIDEFKYNIFIETGTFRGHTIEALKNDFKTLYTIELSQQLYEDAVKKFAPDEKVKLFQGNSSDVLPQIMETIDEPAIFWLDGHYSGGDTAKADLNTPIFKELECIFNAKYFPHVLLIDDARDFGVLKDYPSIKTLKKFILAKFPNASFEVNHDIIQVVLKK